MNDSSTLSDVLLDIQAGKSIQTAEVLARPEEFGVLKVSAITWSEFQADEAKALTGQYEPAESHKVRKGDFLISRANTKEFVGAVVLVDRDYPFRLLSDKTLRLVIAEERASKDFLLYALRAPKARKHIEHFATGTSDSMRNIAQGVITSIPINLPSIDEQRQIAARLKAQLAEVETARQAVQSQLRQAAALKKRALESLFSSVPNWAPIGDAAKLQSGYAFKSDNFKTSGVHLLRNANILPGKVYWDDSVFLSESDAVMYPSYALSKGDVLISLDRPIISSGIKIARVGADDLPALLVQRVGRFLLDPQKLDADYLYAYLQTDLFISKISGHDQSLGVPHISPSQVEAIEMPLPEISIQRKLSKQLNDVMSTWQVAVAALQSQLNDLSKLPKAILAQAFEV
ncbi:restriction endonuclease subunit S [Pseudomonas alliivorans]|nr:restriction endonuclease subunit S [Pseudomonas alliivorans]